MYTYQYIRLRYFWHFFSVLLDVLWIICANLSERAILRATLSLISKMTLLPLKTSSLLDCNFMPVFVVIDLYVYRFFSFSFLFLSFFYQEMVLPIEIFRLLYKEQRHQYRILMEYATWTPSSFPSFQSFQYRFIVKHIKSRYQTLPQGILVDVLIKLESTYRYSQKFQGLPQSILWHYL